MELKSKNDSDNLDYIKFSVSLQCLVGYTLALLVYVYKTKFKMYMRTGFLIVGYGILFLTRFLVHIEIPFKDMLRNHIYIKIAKSVNMIVQITIWIALYFFIFQIEKIKLTLQASTHTHLIQQMNRKKKVHHVILAVYIIADIFYAVI